MLYAESSIYFYRTYRAVKAGLSEYESYSASWHNIGMILSIRNREVNLKRCLRIGTHETIICSYFGDKTRIFYSNSRFVGMGHCERNNILC
jgi:hypothetical protein